jgi:two-component system response regulator AtoC
VRVALGLGFHEAVPVSMADPVNVLVVDDDPAVGKVLGAILRQGGYEARHCLSGHEALAELGRVPYDLVISDLRMPEIDGLALLDEVAQSFPEVPVVMLTAHGTIGVAVEAMKRGARDFLLKPFERDDILFVVSKELQASAPARERVPAAFVSSSIVGSSEAMSAVHSMIGRAAPGLATVLIRGESGTGKELVARAIHTASPRREQPFVKVHCAALPDNLLESELFGYEKGAFTGATTKKPGRVELAEGGTLFLDEIGDITPATQVKLLRVLQDREYERLGGTETLSADVRFMAATHRPLESLVESGAFREDLFYRLNVIPIWLPPLRERPGDVAELARHFCEVAGSVNCRPGAALAPDAIGLLCGLPWPGNVRQLENFIERVVVLSDSTLLAASDVREVLDRFSTETERMTPPPPTRSRDDATLGEMREEAERQALVQALERSGNNRTIAARILGVSRRTLYNKLERFGLL